MIRVNDDELETFMQTLTIKDLKVIIGEYKKVIGISQYRKTELTEAFMNLLSDSEQEEAFSKWIPLKLQELVTKSINILTRWNNTAVLLDEEEHKYSIDITWQGGEIDTCTVKKANDMLEHNCSCKLGERGGICVHLMGLLVLMYLRNIITLNQFPFKMEDVWLDPVRALKDNILARYTDTKDADIELDEYWIFINDETNKVTLRWEGDYGDTRTYNITEINANEKDPKKHITLEEWVVKKVADMQVKFLGKTGLIKEIVTDKFGVVEKIISNPKQYERVKKAYERAAQKFNKESYPKTKDEIRDALQIGLID